MNNICLNLLIIICVSSSFVVAQISPGELTEAHKELEGLSNCTKCHELGEQVLESKCIECHSEIKSLINLRKGYHSSSEVKKQECVKCHAEHFGRNFRIVNFDPDGFDHNKTGYTLTGSHIKLDCNKCHQQKFIADTEIAKREGTYLGLNSNCFSCHEDNHQGTLGDNCGTCHNTEKFKAVKNFDHSKTKFALTGKHQEVDCIKCHPKQELNGEDFQKFRVIQFLNCYPCHSDNHNGKFGRDCKSCHVTSSFKTIDKTQFDHSKTNYPLIGKHRLVSCNQCHKTNLKVKLNHEKCIDCHSDYHESQFSNDGEITDCINCHVVEGFRPSTVNHEKHRDFKFLTDGAHLAIPCQSCHYLDEKWKFINLGRECISCHKNVHGNEIIRKYSGNDECIKCHKTERWDTITFDHKLTEFELLGKHQEQNCRSCHKSKNSIAHSDLVFKTLNANCETCHTDVHAGQFIETDNSTCIRCHTYNNWKPERFDHEQTKFSLKGAHQNLSCFSCHPVREQNGVRFIKYKLENFRCTDCHK